METLNNICPIAHRRYEDVPIDKVKVINSRNRDQEQFDMNVESIDSVGLMKPIRVNDKFLESSGKYELICGEGRLLAHKQLGKKEVLAEVVTCTRNGTCPVNHLPCRLTSPTTRPCVVATCVQGAASQCLRAASRAAQCSA